MGPTALLPLQKGRRAKDFFFASEKFRRLWRGFETRELWVLKAVTLPLDQSKPLKYKHFRYESFWQPQRTDQRNLYLTECYMYAIQAQFCPVTTLIPHNKRLADLFPSSFTQLLHLKARPYTTHIQVFQVTSFGLGRDSSFGKANRYWLEGPGIYSR
jgi:hypothetical protein